MQIGADKRRQSFLVVEPLDGPVLGVGVDDVSVRSARRDNIFSIAAGHRVPVETGDPATAETVGRSAPAIVVLESAAEIVGSLIILRDGIELLDGNVIEVAPGSSGVGTDVDAAIIAVDDAVGVLR